MKIIALGWLATVLFVLGATAVAVSLEYTKEQKFYTVKTADAVYRDLTRGRSNGTWAVYTTVDGKKMIFNGTFTEIEQ